MTSKTGRRLNADFLTAEELDAFGVADADARNIRVHSTAVIVNFDGIRFGKNIRIDPYVVISCRELILGDYIHIATGCAFFGKAPITVGDFSGFSAHNLIYSSSDDYSGQFLTNPTVPSEFTNTISSEVVIDRHCLIGAHSTLLPGSELGEGAAVGSAALVTGALPAWTVSVGTPAKPIKPRLRDCLDLEAKLKKNGQR
jgi:galactoside O-acetyltransferase